MRAKYIICGIIGGLIVAFFLYVQITLKTERQQIKPYITYTRLLGLASDCDKYKDQYGEWPKSLEQMIAFRPELTDWAKDAWGNGDNMWGRYIILVPYDNTLGYGEVISYGRDGKQGGAGLDRDMVVRFPAEANDAWNRQQGEGLKKPVRRLD
jgi:hypothetical protein